MLFYFIHYVAHLVYTIHDRTPVTGANLRMYVTRHDTTRIACVRTYVYKSRREFSRYVLCGKGRQNEKGPFSREIYISYLTTVTVYVYNVRA